jgi:hypothetical protein
MKQILLIATLTLLFGCKKDEPVVTITTSKVSVQVNNQVDGTNITLGSGSHVNTSGETYSEKMLKYYLGHITLIDENGNEVALNEHALIDQSVPASSLISKDAVPIAHYTKIRFNVGIEHSHNHTGDQEGVLDPINGMIWTWDTGYIFFKHEGSFVDSEGDNAPIVYHYGTDDAFTVVELPIAFHSTGNEVKLNLNFNLNALYGSPNTIAFDGNNAHQSTGAGDIPWINNMSENFQSAFSVSIQ